MQGQEEGGEEEAPQQGGGQRLGGRNSTHTPSRVGGQGGAQQGNAGGVRGGGMAHTLLTAAGLVARAERSRCAFSERGSPASTPASAHA